VLGPTPSSADVVHGRESLMHGLAVFGVPGQCREARDAKE
jgi:hypothetical protein